MTKKLSTPFATDSTLRNDVPVNATSDQKSKGIVGYNNGWTEINKLPLENGGQPPYMEDINGVLFDITGNIVDINKGLPQYYDDAYATLIGGYPIGSRLCLNDNSGYVVSTIANNTNNPNTTMTGWVSAWVDNRYSSISRLRSSNETRSTVYIDNYTLSDGRVILCGGLFKLDSSDTTSSDDTALTIVTSSGARYKRILPTNGEYQIDWWFDPSVDIGDYSLTVNRCSNFFDPSQGKDWGDTYNGWDYTGKVKLCPYNVTIIGSGGTKPCKSDIIIYAWTNSWDFKGTELDFSSVTTSGNTHVWIKKSMQSKVDNYRITGAWTKDDIVLNSDGTFSTVNKANIGLYLHSNAPNINGVPCSNLGGDNVTISGVCYPIKYGNNAYIHKWKNFNVYNFFSALTSLNSPTNSGENIKFEGGVIANGFQFAKGFRLLLDFNGTSLDYCGSNSDAVAMAFKDQALWHDCDTLLFTKCHHEWGNPYSRWMGPYLNSDKVIFKDSPIIMAEEQYFSHPYFCKAKNISTGYLEIDGSEIPNMSLNGNSGSMGNGQKIVIKNIDAPSHQYMWKNLVKTPLALASDNYINSLLPSITAGSSVYKAATRYNLNTSATGKIIVAEDAANNSIIIGTESTDTNPDCYVDFFFKINPNSFFSLKAVVFPRATHPDSAKVSVSADIFTGCFDSAGAFQEMQRISWGPSLNSGTLLSGYPFDSLNASWESPTHGRLRVRFTNFSVTSGNPKLEYVLRSPQVETLNVRSKLTYATH